ncbi:MAG: hypothetical protein GXO76_00365, partial [Calditrichaeota bacterium]|nr:hypothetical protein [Calditrichota bacterium]
AFLPKGGPQHPFVVDVTSDTIPPKIVYTFREPRIPADHVTVTATITDNSGVKVARVYYKVEPSYLPWKAVNLKRIGKNRYRADIPLTPHGLLFQFEAIDNHGNGTKFPDTWKARPYFVVEAWNPETGKR